MHNILSNRQIEILELRTSGLENKEIAKRLDISISSVQNTLTKVCKKLGARNVTNAVATYTLYISLTAVSQQYVELPLTRDQVNKFLDKKIRELDIQIFADAICNDISDQSDYTILEGYEWDEFVMNIITFISHIQANKLLTQ